MSSTTAHSLPQFSTLTFQSSAPIEELNAAAVVDRQLRVETSVRNNQSAFHDSIRDSGLVNASEVTKQIASILIAAETTNQTSTRCLHVANI
jgi:hypothetical protein